MMTREQAIAALKMCGACKRWITTRDCDHCWVDQHKCPPTLVSMTPKAVRALKRAIEIGNEAERMLKELRALGLEAR